MNKSTCNRSRSTWFPWRSSQVVQTRKQCWSIHSSLSHDHDSQQQSVCGISSTLTNSLSVFRISIVKFSSIDTSEKPSSTLDYSNLETYSILWLDPLVTESKEYLEAQQRLRTSINYLKVFKTTEECEQYLPLVPAQDRIIFLVNNHLGQDVVPRFHPLRQIFAIYIYHDEQKRNGQWTKEYPKVTPSSSSLWMERSSSRSKVSVLNSIFSLPKSNLNGPDAMRIVWMNRWPSMCFIVILSINWMTHSFERIYWWIVFWEWRRARPIERH